MAKQNTKLKHLSFNIYWLDFVRTCLKPLVRILVRNKVEFKSFINLVREIYVEEGELYVNETSSNSRGKISSIAHQTGLDRREVSSILKDKDESMHVHVARSREGNILDHWVKNPPFCDENGKPMPLKRSGPGLSFEVLTQRFGKNISHGPILESFIEAGCVEIKNNKVHLIKKSFIPKQPVSPEKIDIAAKSIKRLADTINHNLENSDQTIFQRNLFSLKIPRENRKIFKNEVNEFMQSVFTNSIIPEFEDLEKKHGKNTVPKYESRMGLGFFYFEEFE